MPIAIDVFKSNIHDASALQIQLQKISFTNNSLRNKHNYIIGDSAYDSSKLKAEIKKCKLGKLITEKNIRNSKYVTTQDIKTKLILKTRYIVEHLNNIYKKIPRLNTRYDKYVKNYEGYLKIVSSILIIKALA